MFYCYLVFLVSLIFAVKENFSSVSTGFSFKKKVCGNAGGANKKKASD